jgi:hypothetical protein
MFEGEWGSFPSGEGVALLFFLEESLLPRATDVVFLGNGISFVSGKKSSQQFQGDKGCSRLSGEGVLLLFFREESLLPRASGAIFLGDGDSVVPAGEGLRFFLPSEGESRLLPGENDA